ncbi:MAG TPA: M42 family peptidase [Candidatus Eubacterium faecavium]|nr:M42 family peptidase [Candidatus Eubacterium faecavium]
MLKELCFLNGTSGDERAVREYIIEKIRGKCDYKVDALGSVIAFKKGKKTPDKKVMLCAHMDEVGFIITHITDEGYLKFSPVGGIDAEAVLTRRLSINGKTGVVGAKAVHLMSSDEKESVPKFSDFLIDIGAANKAETEKYVQPGDYAYFVSDYCEFGDGFVKAKALDDRIGCMLLIELIHSDLEYDTYFCFNVQEEVGLRGAACTSYSVKPDIAVVLESTTAADIEGVSGAERCCILGNGPVISYMDGRTVYDRELYQKAVRLAENNGIKAQTKTKIAGGNDAGAVQTSAGGCRVAAVSLPCRYIHTGASVVKKSDIEETRRFLKVFLTALYD